MYQYHCLNPIAKVGLARFTAEYVETDQIAEADALLVRSAKIKPENIPERTIAIARAGAGVNNIPLEACSERGVVVFNTPGANANGVKELVLAGMFLAARDIIGGANWVRKHSDDDDLAKLAEKKKKKFAGSEIYGKKLGIIGLGAIGQRVANAATHLGMDVLGYDPYISVDAAWNLSRTIRHITDVDDIYRECDYITIHVPLLPSTEGMISRDAIAMMKPNVVLLNFARDILVDEPAVIEALSSGRIARYVTDFANATVAGAEGTIILPHLGASTQESEDNCAKEAVKALREYIENGNIRNSVNYPSCDMGACESAGRIAICHGDIAGIIMQFTKVISDAGINIANLVNKSKGNYAYSMLDLASPATEQVVGQINAIEGVIRTRIIK